MCCQAGRAGAVRRALEVVETEPLAAGDPRLSRLAALGLVERHGRRWGLSALGLRRLRDAKSVLRDAIEARVAPALRA